MQIAALKMVISFALPFISLFPAWITNDTLKSNILFGADANDETVAAKYKNILSCCALESDLKMLKAGDMTEIGERGINLSGGQKARVSIGKLMTMPFYVSLPVAYKIKFSLHCLL